MVYFETHRLLFRDWNGSDRREFRKMNGDPEVMEFFTAVLTAEKSDALVDRIEKGLGERGWGLWAVELKHDGQFIGFTGFNPALFNADFNPSVEIGWRLKKEAWGHGYATEGAVRCLEYGFANCGFEIITSFTSVLNVRSERVMVRIGMKKDREFDHPDIPEGNRLRKHVLYTIKKGDRE